MLHEMLAVTEAVPCLQMVLDCSDTQKTNPGHLVCAAALDIRAKPIYGGWLLLAPEGTDFDNPVHRSRKWQRRFFILYEHGLLRYALDEMPTTLPQGTINMNQCTDVVDGESRTGQKFSLCILTPEKEHFIRAENKEIISGWLEMLIVYPRTNKQNQKKKRKVEPPTPQEPGPAKMAVTSSNIPSAEKVPATKSTLWQEEMRGKDQADGSSSLSPVQSPVQNQAAPASSLKEPVLESKEDESSMNGDRLDCGRKARVESGYFSLEKTKQDSKLEEQQLLPPPSPPSPSTPNNRRSQVIEKFEALDIENSEHMETNVLPGSALSSETRQGRSEKRVFPRKRDSETAAVGSIPEVSASPLSPHRRAKSLDRRSTESSMTPDLLNFKKGWLTKQYEDGQWKKHWFVLTDQSLRYYRDSKAEEAADLDGEIDLSTCYDVTEYPVQRNYGFQIHTKEGEFTLSAMTSGIRRNWIQTIMKHVRPTTAPDVTSSLPEEKSKTSSSFETCPKPSEKQDLDQAEMDPEQKRSRARERRREGRSKTFDWAEFRPIQQALAQERASTAESAKGGTPTFPREPSVLDTDAGELERERARRREERRKRFEMTDAVDGTGSEDALRMEVDRVPGLPVTTDVKPQNVHVEIEQRWHQVETTPLREEKQIPIMPLHLTHSEDREDRLSNHHLTTLLEKELEQSQKEALDLLEQNRLLQDQLKVALGREQSAREGYVLQTEVAASPSGAWQRLHKVNQDLQSELEAQCQRQELINQQIQSLKRSYGEAKDVIRHHEAEIQSLQARLGNAAAELSIKEQTLAKLKSDLKMEKEKAKEQLEEWQHSETTLSSQLKVSEQKLKAAEALLLEKTQELRDLEVQQALQRDHQKEVQRLQDRIADLSMQLSASERARILMEEKLQKNYEALLESCEKEKQVLIQSLKEVEDKANEYENQLQNNEQQMEILQKEKLNAKCEGSEIVHQLEEQLEMKEASIQKLAEHIEELERERDQIKCRFQELMNQVAESDNEVAKLQAKLKMEETNYQNLEHSYEEVSDQFQSMQEVLKEKEEELRHVKEMHLRIVEKKDQDLNEALVKMAALGSSLEETEVKLQAKEDALQKLANAGSGPCAEDAEDFCTNLEADENPNPELGQHLQTRDELPGLHYTPKDDDEGTETSQRQAAELTVSSMEEPVSPSKSLELQDRDIVQKILAKPETGFVGAKRQRIRFSNIQCQKYIHADGSEKNWTSSTSSDTSQDRSLSEESMSSELPLGYPSSGASDSETYLSIIHSLETKLYITEEKLKDVTLKLESQQAIALANLLSKKLLLEGEFWSQVEELRKHLGTKDKEVEGKMETKVRESFHQRLKTIEEDLHNTKTALQQHKCMLEEIIKAYRTPEFDRVMHQISEALEIQKDVSDQTQVCWGGSHPEVVLHQDPVKMEEGQSLTEQSSETLVAIQEDLALQLKDKANILKEISVALLSLSPEEAIQDCQKLLKVSQSMGDLERYSSLLVQDAVIQAQVCYGACRVRLEYERQLKFYKESLQNMDTLCQERGQAVAVLREEYEDLLRKQRSEYGEMITILERENADLQAKVSQLENQRRLLEEEEHKRSKSISELKSRYEEEIRNVIEQLNRTEDTLKAERAEGLNQLDAVVRDKQDMERYHLEQMQTLEDRFQAKVKELQVIHSEELQTLQEHYSQNLQRLQGTLDDYQRQHPEAVPSQGPGTARTAEQPSGGMQLSESELNSMHGLRERIQELEAQMDAMRDELENKHLEGSTATLREKYQKDFENLKATCERGFAAMEETHQKKIEDLQRQHQRELEKLREEKDRLLAEETAATISAIEAMKNAHREELERELEKSQRSQISSVNADIEALRRQYLEELQSVQRELEVLSEQYSQKCLENAHLAQALEAERQALRQCQRENQELNAHNQELNNRLAAEITQLRTLLTGEGGGEAAGSPLTQGKDAYELEVLLRVKESEIQYLKQEISSLKDELQTALREKKYASDKHKDIYTELSIVKAKADCDISRLKEQLKAATEALGEKSPENTSVSGYDIMKSKSQSPLLSRSHGKTERNQSPGSLSRRV
ncbi:myosin phosphatase Rho-interacting protein isoform D [Alligator mississippiensis]|uniref:Myosin phosphatase Rho-interacting protein isoform D n=1 Tax=Alligator mississippiensis TaxID=8496 RepID=A0A151N2A3_ALLMI|nr:myosin phosphatase Rho-interacting protein isoform D [Alligator mississippiensis]